MPAGHHSYKERSGESGSVSDILQRYHHQLHSIKVMARYFNFPLIKSLRDASVLSLEYERNSSDRGGPSTDTQQVIIVRLTNILHCRYALI